MRAKEFIQEDASVGATVAGAMAPVAQAMGNPVRRTGSPQSAKYMNSLTFVKRKKRNARG